MGSMDFQATNLEAQLRAVFEMVVNIGVMEQHFGGNAADVQAGAAEKGVFLHHDGLEAQLAGTDGGYVSARSAADNRHVVLCHAQSPFRRARTCLSANGNQVDRTLAADLNEEGPYRDELGILAAARAGRNLAARQRPFTTEGTEHTEKSRIPGLLRALCARCGEILTAARTAATSRPTRRALPWVPARRQLR